MPNWTTFQRASKETPQISQNKTPIEIIKRYVDAPIQETKRKFSAVSQNTKLSTGTLLSKKQKTSQENYPQMKIASTQTKD